MRVQTCPECRGRVLHLAGSPPNIADLAALVSVLSGQLVPEKPVLEPLGPCIVGTWGG